jgi:hypothetical protein
VEKFDESARMNALTTLFFNAGAGYSMGDTAFRKVPAFRNVAPVQAAVRSLALQSHRAPRTVNTLHRTAKRAIHSKRFNDAERCYEILLQSSATATPRTFMLKALLEQRLGLMANARKTFRAGYRAWKRKKVARDEFTEKDIHEEAQLLQAWGLFESKHGTLDLAKYLVQNAVSLDNSLRRVLDWQMFRNHRSKFVF